VPDSDPAAALLAAFDTNTQVAPLSDVDPALTLDDGYRIAGEIRTLRTRRGEDVVGRKIGFTNRTLWPIYNVDAPVWGWMYQSGVPCSYPQV